VHQGRTVIKAGRPKNGGSWAPSRAGGLLGAPFFSPSAIAYHAAMSYLVPAGEARIETYAEGKGPLVVLLPSRGRGAEDYEDLAHRIARAGYRVLRPQPRGIGRSRGPMQGLTLHDLARDVGAVIAYSEAGPAVLVGHAFGNW